MTGLGRTVGTLLSGSMAGAASGWVFAIAVFAGTAATLHARLPHRCSPGIEVYAALPLLGCDRGAFDKLRQPLVAQPDVAAVQRLELAGRKRMRRRPRDQRVGPSPELGEVLNVTDPLHVVEEEIALQKRRVGSVHKRIGVAKNGPAPCFSSARSRRSNGIGISATALL